MKRLFATIVALMLLVNLAACGSKEASVDDGADGNSFSKTETSVSEEMEEMDEVEEQETPEIAEVANIPKDISEINPDDYWQGEDYFDLERFLIDCGCEIYTVQQDEGADAGTVFFVLPDKSMGEFGSGNYPTLPNALGFWYKPDDLKTISMSKYCYSVGITANDYPQQHTNYEHIYIRQADIEQLYRLIKLVDGGYDGSYCPFAGCGYMHFYEMYTSHSENE